jgi:hypothetical protein
VKRTEDHLCDNKIEYFFSLHRVLKNLDDWHGGADGSVVIGSFIEFTTSHQHLLFPAFQMQLRLRNKVRLSMIRRVPEEPR